MRITNLFEDYSEYETTRWVHYSDYEMMKIHTRTWHNDPLGIYLFPEQFAPKTSMWQKRKYMYIATLKPDTRVLDLPRISDDDLDVMLEALHATAIIARSIEQYPLENETRGIESRIMRSWSILRGQMGSDGNSKARWNKIIRTMGYDVIFDDKGIIHSAEPIQLLVLDPRVLNVIGRQQPKRQYFAKMSKVLDELKAICEPFGEVTTEGPKMMRSGWLSSSPKALAARLEVKKSEEQYASFNITRGEESSFEHVIRVSLGWSSPRLDYGVGAQYNVVTDSWEHRGLESIKNDLTKIFKPLPPEE